ncbi:hypothetical protein [Aeromonas enteropelogenes]|uniref:Uncharacterized protein n=1 Tax=Aeromonas enteropelogenes TaxID=29489 RepID=A0A175VIW5_AEREN|nr:hypothetical protein [Aeromonas enteropelogenes]KXU80571.1 hypothetical protein LCR_10760 [Aeromonas enteropelogenes]
MSETTEHQQNEEADGANHYYSEQYLELQKEPVLYEWQIDHRQRLVREMAGGVCGIFWIIGLLIFINSDSQNAWQLTLFCIVFGILGALQGRYLFAPNQLYHYRMTTKGIYYTQQDKIPEMAYTIARGIGGLLIVGSIIAVGLVGPLALAGAGAGVFLAFKITNMKPEKKYLGAFYTAEGTLKTFREDSAFIIESLPFKLINHIVVNCNDGDFDNVYKIARQFTPNHNEKEVFTYREFRG